MLDKLLSYARRHALLRPGDRVGVAVSGGADSTALLRLLLEAREQLGIALSVVHFNHKIRGAEAEADEQVVRDLARRFDLAFHCDSADTPAYAAEHKLSLEAAGRDLRYTFFQELLPRPASVGPGALAGAAPDITASRRDAAALGRGALDKIATAHTRDDQAESVLMRFLRGAGTKGLAGIYPATGSGIIRPLLEITRAELRAYLERLGQSWREDASNLDVAFARNRLRHEIMPLLRQLNPGLDQVLAETAEIARAEESWWNQQTGAAQAELWTREGPSKSGALAQLRMRVDVLLSLPLALQRRLIRAMAEHPHVPLDFHHVEAVLALAASLPTRNEKVIELPNGVEAVRQDRELWFRHRCQTGEDREQYDVALPVPGEVQITGRKIRAAIVSGAELSHARAPFDKLRAGRVPHAGAPQADEGARVTRALLNPLAVREGLRVRNWRAGDRYQAAHTAAPKKLKELLQARHIPRAQKPFWPVVVSGEEIVWVPGFPPPESFQVRDPDAPVLLLEEVPLQPEGEKGP